jgi:hypothetical protein
VLCQLPGITSTALLPLAVLVTLACTRSSSVRLRTGGAAFGAALLFTLVVASTASAHVVKPFGTYSVAMGWLHEPTYVGIENAVQVVVKDQNGKPVADLESGDLQVVISAAGQQTAALPLEPSYDDDTGLGTPGEYDAVVIPTQVGDYTFHLTGSIHGTAVDESVTSSDQTFDSVTAGTDEQFPVKLPALSDLSTLIGRVDGRATGANTAATQAQQAARTASTDAAQAKSAASRAMLVGAVVGGLGVVLGLAGLLVGLFAVRTSRRRT